MGGFQMGGGSNRPRTTAQEHPITFKPAAGLQQIGMVSKGLDANLSIKGAAIGGSSDRAVAEKSHFFASVSAGRNSISGRHLLVPWYSIWDNKTTPESHDERACVPTNTQIRVQIDDCHFPHHVKALWCPTGR